MSGIVHVVNPGERTYTRSRFVLTFGAYGATYCYVWADCLDDALECAAEWLLKHAPGHIMAHDSEALQALVREAADELGLPDDDVDHQDWGRAYEAATVDMTYTESGYLRSWEWGIAWENPTRKQLMTWAHEWDMQFQWEE